MTGAVTRNCEHGVFGVPVVLAAATFAGHPDRGDSAARIAAAIDNDRAARPRGAVLDAGPYETE